MKLKEELIFNALRIRRIEEKVAEIYPSDKIQSPVHLSIGQEHHIVSLISALEKEDIVFSSYRSHAAYLARGGDLKKFFAELYGKSSGISKGKAGSMHLSTPEHNVLGASAIVGGGFSHAMGYAYKEKLNPSGQVTCVISGDGSVEEGVFFETLNFASLKRLPLLILIEDNNLAVNTRKPDRQNIKLEKLAESFGVDFHYLPESFDLVRNRNSLKKVRNEIQKKQLPCLVSIKTQRYYEHVGINQSLDMGEKDLVLKRMKDDPLNKFNNEDVESEIKKEIDEAVDFAEKSSFPTKIDLLKDVY